MKIQRGGGRTINIMPSNNNGWIVTVGCVTMVYTDLNMLGSDLVDYLSNPEEYEDEFNRLNSESQPATTCDVSTVQCSPGQGQRLGRGSIR